MNSLAYGFLVKHNMCKLSCKLKTAYRKKSSKILRAIHWLNLAQLGLPLCQFPKELLKAKYLAKVCQSPVAWLHSYTDCYFCYCKKLTMALNNPYTAHALRAYHNFQSKQANSITLFRRRPNNKQFSPLKRKSRKA